MESIQSIREIINHNQSRSIIVSGSVYDLFFDGKDYVPLVECLSARLKPVQTPNHKGIIQLICKLNNPIEIRDSDSLKDGCHSAMDRLSMAWEQVQGKDAKPLSKRLQESGSNTTFALELLRQITECNRKSKLSKDNLLIIVESVDLLIPESEVDKMSIVDRQRIAIVHDWFCDPAFINGGDTVILISESRSSIHHRISRLPQVLGVDIGMPDLNTRHEYLKALSNTAAFREGGYPNDSQGCDEGCYGEWLEIRLQDNSLAEQMTGLSMYAIRQLVYSQDLKPETISAKVEEYMISQLGDGVVEFKRPKHAFADVRGFSKVKKFMKEELLPAFKGTGDEAIAGAAVGGPIGGGKTYICEAFASELGGVPVITLKNIRSKWFGETDAIFERIRRIISSFNKIVIFVDEADTQFGDLGDGAHETEKRLTGKIQAMMSDPALRGKVIWFLMTARIHRLSADIRRPGRMDLIIPILDPEGGDDKIEFCKWAFGEIGIMDNAALLPEVEAITHGYSAASYQMLRTQIKIKKPKNLSEALDIARDLLQPDIAEVREYQSIQARLNCTRASLLDLNGRNIDDWRKQMRARLKTLEAQGIS